MRLFFCFLLLCPVLCFADTLSNQCPEGWIAIEVSAGVKLMSQSDTCDGYIKQASSCLSANPSGTCMMYAPVGVSYTDERGVYEFTDVCEMQ